MLIEYSSKIIKLLLLLLLLYNKNIIYTLFKQHYFWNILFGLSFNIYVS